MRIYKSILAGLAGGVALLMSSFQANAQCTPTFSGAECVGTPIQFTGSSTGTSHDWDFNGENSLSGQRNVKYAFKTPGTKTVTYVTTINGSKCTGTVTLTIKESPKVKFKLMTLYEQCFEKNLFCFRDSSSNPNGAKIIKTRVVIGDGQFFEYTNPVFGAMICFSIKDERGGKFDMYIELEDANGCTTSDTIKAAVSVREKIGARFTRSSTKNPDCDSVSISVNNVSRIDKSQVKTVTWDWGDGTFSNDWGPTITKKYKGAGIYNAKLIIETLDGCIDSFKFAAAATVFNSNARIIADRDSTCISEPKITFGVDVIPFGATGFLWNFGDPPTGPQNFNNRTWTPEHSFSGLGPFQIKLTYQHPVCGNRTAFDTVLIIGPVSTIEIPFNRIAEHEVFQCPKDVMDTVHFKNFSTFYHNDRDMTNDDSTFYKTNWNGDLGHVFDNAQTWVKPKGKDLNGGYSGFNDKTFRLKECVVRLWDFGDTYAPKCTTDVLINKNVNVNCQYSHDTLPTHYYKSWDLILLSDFKNAPMEDAIFLENTGVCKRINVWPSDSFYIIEDSLMVIPRTAADSAKANNYPGITTKTYLWESKLVGKGERFIENNVDIELKAGDSALVGPEKGPFTLHIGPKTISLAPKQIVKAPNTGDTVRFKFTIFVKKDTLPLPLYNIRKAKGESMKIIGKFRRIPNGTAGLDYVINYQRFRELYYAKIPQCNNVKLKHWDTCHVLKCENEATKTLALMHANAGGVGSGLTKQSIECLGSTNPQYGITFVLSDLKPGCTFSDVQFNKDTFCNPNAWLPLGNGVVVPGNRPPGMPYMGYQIASNPPSRYSTQYTASDVCGPGGCITVGIIVGNGVSKSGTKPLCADTQYYDRFACFPLIDPSFEVVTPKPNAAGVMKVCKGDPIVVRPIPANLTNTRDLKSLRWELSTGNASPYYSKSWRRSIQEDYYHGQYIKDSGTSKIYNYMVVTRGGENVAQQPCTNNWNDGILFTTGKPDTIVTAIITKWDTAADVSEVWESIKERLDARGFDPFSLSPVQIAKMIWNNVGIIGQPSTGAYGCIDTTGFGKLIKFYLNPYPDYTTIIHPRDTNIVPLDKYNHQGKDINAYTFRPQWSGYHLVSLSMTSSNGKCDEFAAAPVIVGFAMMLELPDTIVCQDQANTLAAKPDYRMFHPDPINFGTWDLNDYWRDAQRQADIFAGVPNREPFTRWDWNKKDDDVSNPQTIFGGAPYGATGVGTPWIQLGGGGPGALYYKNDSGVYEFRNIAGDSTGCMDTITKRLFVTRLDVSFNLSVETPSCNSIIEFFDSTHLFDPCNWAIKNCTGPQPTTCDFITEWFIDWGDGITNLYKRSDPTQEGLPPRIAHKYTRNGWFNVCYKLKTDQGCSDSFCRFVYIPGPRPKFEFTDKAGNEVTICSGDSIQFTNTTDSATTSSDWTWFFGDGKIANTSVKNLYHTYQTPGRYMIFLEQYDSLIVPPNIRKFCPATFPDTPFQKAFIVNVLGRDSVRGSLLKTAICPGDSNTFVDNSDTSFKSFKWVFTNTSTGDVDSITVTSKSYTRQFTVPGTYRVVHTADYDPARPRPWCPTNPVVLTFLVDSVVADFDIDSSNKPTFCFTRKTVNGTEFLWGFNHQNDITKGPLRNFIENSRSSDNKVCFSYDSTGVYWVCLIAKNSTGCVDTICKPVTVDLYIYLANVFTPDKDGDGKNDTYKVPIQGHDKFELKIFNRWGERVFMTEDARVEWNGKVNNDGADCPEGTYFYQLTYNFKGKELKKLSGSINLIR